MLGKRTSGRRRRSVAGLGTLALVATAAGVGIDAGPATAAFPGRNGRILCSKTTTNSEIVAYNPDGSDPRQLTFNPAADIEPTMSPDGTRIAWTSTRDSGDQEIWIMYEDGSGAKRLTFTPGEDRPGTFSPDGTQISFQTARFPASSPGPGHSSLEIMRMNIDGSNPIRLTNNDFQDSFAHWSPLGDRIAFTTNRDQPADQPASSNYFEIYTMNASDGSNPVNVTNSLGEDSHAHWSPDGTMLTYHSRRDFVPNPGATQVEIYRSNADGTNPVRLTGPDNVFDIFPVWSPDGTKIAWPHDFPGDLWTMNAADGSGKVALTTTPDDESRCDWSRLLPCTISGSGNILGTPGDDVICGSAGNDSIAGLGGNDVIYAGAGNDSVSAGDGNDIVFGDHGDDRILGDAGNDMLFGDQENDQLSGGAGDDVVSGSEGTDQVGGSDGNDECYAESIRGCELPAPQL